MLRIGLVGYGGMGKVHASNYDHIISAQLVAICDSVNEVTDRDGVTLYKSIEAMLMQEQLDIVDVCTPTFLHKEAVMKALNAGIHVICEKPIALHLEDAKEMYALAESKGKQLMIGQVLQFSTPMQVLRELVEGGEYGKALDASFLRLSACPKWATGSWLMDKDKSGLIPFDLHIHDLDMIVSLFGKPNSYKMSANGRTGIGYQEHYRFLYQYDNLDVMAEAAWYNADFPFTANWRVYFEEAVVECVGTTVTAYQFGVKTKVFDTTEKVTIATGINLPPTGMFYEELTYFLKRINDGVDTSQFRKEDILTVIELLEEIVKNSSDGSI